MHRTCGWLLLLMGCGGGAAVPDASASPDAAVDDAGSADSGVPAPVFPLYFRLEASASSPAGAVMAECTLDWIFELAEELRREPRVVEYRGVHGGEAYRSVLDETGAGFAFHIDVGGETIVRWTHPDTFEIEIPINETADGRFYTSLARLTGTIDADGNGAGTWRCDPLDIDQGGYLDDEVSAEGTWTTAPIDTTPTDPCAENNGDCDPMTTCTNEGGAAVCGPCPAGTVGTGTIGCFECHRDTDCVAGEYCDATAGNTCAPGCRAMTPEQPDDCGAGMVCDETTHTCGAL